jgi:chorismate-pyruvate lyase
MLDFYHASEHLWAVARSLCPADELAARIWVEPLLSQLKHGQEAGVL